MKKKDWRETPKVRMKDCEIRYEYAIIMEVLGLIFEIIFIIGALSIYNYKDWIIFDYLAAALGISGLVIICLPPTPREIFARIQCSVFYLECCNRSKTERKRATATMIRHKRNAYLITSADAVLNEEKKLYEDIQCGLMAKSLLCELFYEVEIVKYDHQLNIAILKFKEDEKYLKPYIQPLKWITVKKVKGGDTVYLIGNMQGNGVCISSGMVNFPLIYEKQHCNYYIQSTVNGAYGTSGGALLNNRGVLVGIHIGEEMKIQGAQFSIPMDRVIEFIENTNECCE